MKTFQNDLFFSYSSEDRPWAAALHAALTAAPNNLKVFFDQVNLTRGEKWEPNLRTEIERSRHMVILWSDLAKQSDWVQNERASFLQQVGEDRSRRLFAINLQNTSAVLSAYQAFDELRMGGWYKPGVAIPGDPTFQVAWNGIVTGLVREVHNAAGAYPIWLLFFTLLRGELAQIDPTQQMAWGSSLEDYLKDVGIAQAPGGTRRDTLLPRYDPHQRALWEPFNRPGFPIRDIVDNALNAVHGDPAVKQRQLSFRWEIVGDDFWGAAGVKGPQLMQVRREYVRRMCENRSLIIADPVAFYTPNGMFLFNELSQCIGSDKAAILVLPPLYTDAARLRINQELEAAVQSFVAYYKPAIPATESAACGLAITDETDIARLLRLAVGRHVRTLDPPEAPHPFVRTAAAG